ncbi:Carboxypeptidase regulatory-like domain-containing protein [Pedobacter steynii]|uniref:Carboxypeptidase regulatory-like domain-containing protein n=1 Tax=Pedobacter steynii TaxID=430522 RepID=A0A1H0DW17_9SPHI|nr:carboxypeptidase-like regulatory domain-containing protein [Pedobacter steynii]NQX41852.1 carboxypeptidase regulatory-like domain-containing protein [Pedobacter steynii]SDN74350.1 Carboxypeptidase regulatory-like domain-containing protein [Pedobacter steynii]
MKTFYLNLFFLFIGSGIALAQDTEVQATVIGAVTDEQKKPLDYATVALFNQADSSLVKSAITDASGKFQFLQIKPGNYYVKSSLMGYSTSKSNLFKIDAKNLHITLRDLRLNSGKTSARLKSPLQSLYLSEKQTN